MAKVMFSVMWYPSVNKGGGPYALSPNLAKLGSLCTGPLPPNMFELVHYVARTVGKRPVGIRLKRLLVSTLICLSSYSASIKHMIVEHIRVAHKREMYKCNQCDSAFTRKSLKIHIEGKHRQKHKCHAVRKTFLIYLTNSFVDHLEIRSFIFRFIAKL